ncbi:MAG: FMN-binding protein [Patescibacteria group bacterium]|nr:FMN-binding protein [Patescibacteria group bacterium]
MKKFFIVTAVVIAFISYSMYQRVFGIKTASVVLSPKSSPPVPNQSNQSKQSQALPTATPIPTAQNTPAPTQPPTTGYKDGTFTGDTADAFYGYIQVAVTIAGGKITNVQFLQYPNDNSTSSYINSQADPMLSQEAIQAQNANVDIISGATDSSQAFVQSLQSALGKAKS